jgi:hypothetical protein
LIEMLNSFSVRLWIKKLLKREIFPYPTRLNPVQCNRILKTHGFKTVKRKGSFWLVPSYRNKSKLIFRCMKFIEDILFLNHIVLFSPQYFIFAQKI